MRQLKITNQITDRRNPIVSTYLSEIGNIDMISQEEEVRLSALIKNGDQQALERLVRANLRFVVSVAKQYQHQGLSLPDLINEGNLGLIKAAQRFDETKGFKFISYAVWWIRQCILQALAEQSRVVRIPFNKIDVITKINKAVASFEQEHEREPTAEEIGNILGEDFVTVAYLNSRHVISLDSRVSDENDATLIENISCGEKTSITDGTVLHEALRRNIERTLCTLTPRQSEILKMYYGINGKPMTLEQIGDYFDLTHERVRQIKEKALLRIGRNKAVRDLLIGHFENL